MPRPAKHASDTVDGAPRRTPQNVLGSLCWALAAGSSAGLLVFQAWLGDPLVPLVLENRISPEARFWGPLIVLGSAFLLAIVVASGLWRGRARGATWLPLLRPLTLAWLLPPLLSPSIWHAQPLLCLSVGITASIAAVWWLVPVSAAMHGNANRHVAGAVVILLAALIVGYSGFVAVATIHQHQLLETRAYDLGIMENVFWHTTQGRLFASSIEGRNHLGVHTSFIYLLLAPAYLLFPSAYTLLVAQALLVALAAWPLFLVARLLLRSDSASLLVASLYLLHPAIEGANFYDFHELAFAPLLFFAALYALLKQRTALLWASVALLLLVKEDCALIIAALGVVALFERRKGIGLALLATGGLGLLLLQGVVIPHFAGGESSFSWYYTDMIPSGEGPVGLLRTLLVNPLYSVRVALTLPKILYLLQTLAPVLFLCLFGRRSLALVAYGLGMTVFASREYLFVLGFQYAWQFVPEAFAGALIALQAMPATKWGAILGLTQKRALTAMAAVSMLIAFHHGMLSPYAQFRSGFRTVRFGLTNPEAARFREVQQVEALIPASASVTASETLVPHVAGRMRIQTLRFAADGVGKDYDYFFVLRSDVDAETVGRYPYVFQGQRYVLVHEGRDTLLFRRADITTSFSR